MENREEKLKELREAVRANRNNAEKRRKTCDDFSIYDDFEENSDPTRCDRCKEPYPKGQRAWHFQGAYEYLCDDCFLDILESEVYREYGLNFETYEGGGTIWVRVEGEEEIVCGR